MASPPGQQNWHVSATFPNSLHQNCHVDLVNNFKCLHPTFQVDLANDSKCLHQKFEVDLVNDFNSCLPSFHIDLVSVFIRLLEKRGPINDLVLDHLVNGSMKAVNGKS